MQDEIKMIYIQMLSEDSMMLTSDMNDFRNRVYYEYGGTVTNPGPQFAKKILKALIKGCY
jgi:hypothetical protein